MSVRDDFTEKTKRTLGNRVGWLCAFPGCDIATIGPGPNPDDVTRLGEAAHITAAAAGGPRYDATLTSAERKAAMNGVWMCRRHARLIDVEGADQFSESTIRQWKELAEQAARRRLVAAGGPLPLGAPPTTLVAFGYQFVTNAVWLGAANDVWRFKIVDMVRGRESDLLDLLNHSQPEFVVVASQGDGRFVQDAVTWERLSDGSLQVAVPITPRAPRLQPGERVDLALREGDLVVENGMLAEVQGVEADIQSIEIALGTLLGEFVANPSMGSLASLYYQESHGDSRLLGELLKLELARLATIPIEEDEPPQLSFIWRVESLVLADTQLIDQRLPVAVELTWSDATTWKGNLNVFIIENLERLHPFLTASPASGVTLRSESERLRQQSIEDTVMGWTSRRPASES